MLGRDGAHGAGAINGRARPIFVRPQERTLPMSDLFNNLSSPSWWIGVVIVSFAINLASAYAKVPLDRALGRLSKRKREKSERAQREISTMLEAAKRQKDGVVLLSIQELRLVIIGISLVALCILILLLLKLESSPLNLTLPLVILVPLALFLAFPCLRRSAKISDVLKLYETGKAE
jgi:hypothetical protein